MQPVLKIVLENLAEHQFLTKQVASIKSSVCHTITKVKKVT
jgi:hypothetical protein